MRMVPLLGTSMGSANSGWRSRAFGFAESNVVERENPRELVQSATGVGDNNTGLLNIRSALTFTSLPVIKLVTGSIVVGDGTGDKDGVIDAGETITLVMTLRNYGAGEATGVVATLTTIDDYTSITRGAANFGDISGERDKHKPE